MLRSCRLAAGLLALGALCACQSTPTGDACAPYEISGDRIEQPLNGRIGDPARGRRIAFDRNGGDCTICHRLPLPDAEFHGNVGPSLLHVGERLDAAQLRLRLVAPKHLNPATVMPAYCRIEGLYRVHEDFAGSSVLDAGEIEDVVAWLSSLRRDGASS